MQTSKWGHPTWYWLHRLPLCTRPDMTEAEQQLWLEFTTLLKDILPCKYCRQSYAGFIEDDPLQAHLIDPQFRGDWRLAFAHWLFQLHNKVNQKLERTIEIDFYNLCCHDIGNDRKQWVNSFWDFISAVLWNFENDEWRIVAYLRFFELLPLILSLTELGERLGSWYLLEHKLTRESLNSLETAKQWGWQFYSNCINPDYQRFGNFQEFDSHYESWRSNTCSLAPPEPGKPQSC